MVDKIITFWAKTTKDGNPGLSVYDHMINVGLVAKFFAEWKPELLEYFNLTSSEIGALAAFHDIGKISPGFQQKCDAWLVENNLKKIAENGCWDTKEKNHGLVTHQFLHRFFLELGMEKRTAKDLATLLGGHHGRLHKVLYQGAKPDDGASSDRFSGIDWETERKNFSKKVMDFFCWGKEQKILNSNHSAFWWLGGLVSVADWIGSEERFFPSQSVQGAEKNIDIAKQALGIIGFNKPQIIHGLSFIDLFGFTPNEMQIKAIETIKARGVYIIEAPMGLGKTEAALAAAYQLMSNGLASGIYFALPTQTTSNRIYIRMNDFLKRIATFDSQCKLIHGNSWLFDSELHIDPRNTVQSEKGNDARIGRDWFHSNKRSMLASFGVGTIDQALLAAVAAKHFFVRHFALAGKVVIIDEVHSYDVYTGTLINVLIKHLVRLGCTIIILSATLSATRRFELLPMIDNDKSKYVPDAYPLITGQTGQQDNNSYVSVAVTPPKDKECFIEFINKNNAENEAITLAKRGGAVIWICDTVGNAQKQYLDIKKQVKGDFPIGLLHSHYPFWRRELIEQEWMDRLGKKGNKRCGSILVSTQVVEQSVDLDADLMVSELAPTDMLLQRMGRLWRHERKNRPKGIKPYFYILKEVHGINEYKSMDVDKITKSLGDKAFVYQPYVLLRTLEFWEDKKAITIPSQIRIFIESTYKERDDEDELWDSLFAELWGKSTAYKNEAIRNSNLWTVALEDQEGVQTRINEIKTIPIVLLKSKNRYQYTFLDNTVHTLDKEKFSYQMAQTIHRNMIKVPEYLLGENDNEDLFYDYVKESHLTGLVMEDGLVMVKGLSDGVRLFFTEEMGLFVERKQGGKR